MPLKFYFKIISKAFNIRHDKIYYYFYKIKIVHEFETTIRMVRKLYNHECTPHKYKAHLNKIILKCLFPDLKIFYAYTLYLYIQNTFKHFSIHKIPKVLPTHAVQNFTFKINHTCIYMEILK